MQPWNGTQASTPRHVPAGPPSLTGWLAILIAALAGVGVIATGGCPAVPTSGTGVVGQTNSADPSNGQADYVGARACAACHADIAVAFEVSAHPFALTSIVDSAPLYPSGGAQVPTPPAGLPWSAVSFVVGGFAHSATFVDLDGFLYATGPTGQPTLWTLSGQPNGAGPGFSEFQRSALEPPPFDFSCFRCHTTGAQPFDPAVPTFVENRPGMAGAFDQIGVQCEACHGPGSGHFSTVASQGSVRVDRSRIFIDPTGQQTCVQCHSRTADADPAVIAAADGFILPYQQAAELRASGGHASFTCTVCHDPHASLRSERATAIRNACTACHADMSMAGHGGAVLTRDDGYTETLSCESCHMPLATRNGAAASAERVGEVARIGDVRTHIFRIDVEPVDFSAMFGAAGDAVQLDAQGRAAVTVDFVCLRCHNGNGIFALTLPRAAEIAPFVHQFPEE